MAKKTAEQEKPKPAAEATAEPAAEPVEATEAADPAVPDVVDDEEARRVYGEKAAAPPSGPGQPGRHARPQRGASPRGRRRVVIDAQAGRRPGQRRERGAPRQEQRREPEAPAGLARLSHDFSLSPVLACIEHAVPNAGLVEQAGNMLAVGHRTGADKDRTAGLMKLRHLLRDRLPFRLGRRVEKIAMDLARLRAVGRNAHGV